MAHHPTYWDPCTPRSHEALVAKSLVDGDARAVLSVLEQHGRPLEEARLAEAVASKTEGVDPDEASVQTVRRKRLRLHHRTLPRLESLGLVDRRFDEGSVYLADRSTIESVGADPTALEDGGSEEWAALAATLAEPRRKSILAVLAEDPSPTFASLAKAVAAREHDVPQAELTDEQVETTEVPLHHVDLPKLVEVGLVEEGWLDGPIELREERARRVIDLLSLDV